MKIEHKLVNSTLYVGLSGELDEHSAVFVRAQLDELIARGGMNKIVMDLSELSFMDSTGIGVMIGRYKKLKTLGIPLMLAGPTKAVDKVLTLSGIYDIMPKIEY